MQTAHTGTFMLYELSKHPEVQEKLRCEVVSVLGESGEADAESLQKMPYLIQVIRETQRSLVNWGFSVCMSTQYWLPVNVWCFLSHRVYPVSPKLARTLDTDVELLGYQIPAGVYKLIAIILVSRHSSRSTSNLILMFSIDDHYIFGVYCYKEWRTLPRATQI